MKFLLISLIALIFCPTALRAVDKGLDAPGPGYREQVELLFPTARKFSPPVRVRVGTPTVRVIRSGSFPDLDLPLPEFAVFPGFRIDDVALQLQLSSLLRAFSEPIRLVLDNSSGMAIQRNDRSSK